MRRTTGLLILLVLAGLVWTSRDRTGPDAADSADAPDAGAADVDAADVVETTAGPRRPPGSVAVVALDPAECSDAGYLCTGIVEMPDARAIRWPDGTGTLRIRVPPPDGVEPTLARELQRQAAAGIREWQGRPLPLRVETSAMGGPADVAVRWVDDLEGDRIGQATVRWRVGGAGPELAVDDFVLSTRDPSGGAVPPQRIRLTAAHEMGHVLGLPHSDDPADVMYPYNTATRLTFRDFRTLEVLYRMPAGARLVPTTGR